MSMAFHPDGRTVLTADHDAGSLAVVDLERAEGAPHGAASASKSFPSIEASMTNWLTIARAATFTVPGFKFADGGNLDLRLRYRTLGVLAPDRSNAILMLHGTTGSGAQFLQPTTADFLFDPSGTSGLRRDSSERPEDIANGHAYH